MPDIGNIFGSIRMRTDGLKRDLAQAQNNIHSFATNTTTTFDKLKSSLKSIGAVAGIAGLGVAVTAGIRKSISEFVSFENALLDLQKVMSDVEGNAKQFIGTVDNLSNKFATASASVLQGAANFKQAGFGVKEAFELQTQALTLVRIGELSAEDASQLLISSLKGFKAPASEAARLVNLMNTVSNKYATTLKELAIGMAELSPVANLMGFSFEETAGMLTPIIEIFRSGSEAGNALKVGLLQLVDTDEKVSKTLKDIGISQFDLNGKLRSGKDILLDVQKAFKGMDANMKLFVTSQLVGVRQTAKMVEIFDGLAKITEITNAALADLDSANKELEIRLGSTGIKIDRMKISLSNMARDIGTFISPVVNVFADSVSKIAKAVSDLILVPGQISRGISQDLKFGILGVDFEEEEKRIRRYSTNVEQILTQAIKRATESGKFNFKEYNRSFTEQIVDIKNEFDKQGFFKGTAPIPNFELSLNSIARKTSDNLKMINGEEQNVVGILQDRNTLQTEFLNKQKEQLELLKKEEDFRKSLEQLERPAIRSKKEIIQGAFFPGIETFPTSIQDSFQTNTIMTSSKRVTDVFKQMELELDKDLNATGKKMIEGFKTIEKEGSFSAERLKVVWGLVAKKIESSALSEEIKKEFDKLDIMYGETGKKFTKEWEDFTEMRNKLTMTSTEFSVNQFEKEFDKFKVFVEQGKLTSKEFDDLRKKGVDEIVNKSKASYAFMEELTRSAARGMHNAFEDLFFRVMKRDFENFGDFMESFVDSLLRTISNALASWVTSSLFPINQSLAASGGGGVGGFLSNLVGVIGGGISGLFFGGGVNVGLPGTSSNFVGPPSPNFIGPPTPFAEGGIVTRPTFGLLGEAGAEAVIPLSEITTNKDRPIELTVVLNNPIDPKMFQKSDEEVVNLIADNYSRGAIIRKVIRRDIGR